jgi:hypothetical protein
LRLSPPAGDFHVIFQEILNMVPRQNNSIKASQTVCGSNTGDEIIIDENGHKWLIVSEFSEFRATGERRAALGTYSTFKLVRTMETSIG